MKVLVAGAGPAGLAAARALAARGATVEVHEAETAPGGRSAQIAIGGYVFDRGAEFFTNFYPRTRALVDEVGLGHEVVEIRGPGALFHEGRLVPMVSGPISALTTSLFGWRTKLRLRKLSGTVLSGRLDFSDPVSLAPEDVESAEDYSRRVFGDEFTELGLRPGLESLTLSPIGRTSRALFLAQAQEGPSARFYCVRGGMGRFCDALASGLDVRTGSAVAAVRRAGPGIEADLATGERLAFDAAVLAVPAPVAVRLLGDASARLEAFLRTAEYAAAVKLELGLDRPIDLAYPGVIPVGPGFEGVAGLQFVENKGTGQVPSGAGGLGVVARGALAARLLDAPDEEVERELAGVSARILGGLPGIVCRAVTRIPQGVPLFPPGRYKALAAFDPSDGPIHLAGDYLVGPSVEGAIRSGERAAKAIA